MMIDRDDDNNGETHTTPRGIPKVLWNTSSTTNAMTVCSRLKLSYQ